MELKCTPERKIYPSDKEFGFMVVEYRISNEQQRELPDPSSPLFKAVGLMLPFTSGSTVTLYGDKWESDGNGNKSFAVTGYDEQVRRDAGSIAAWLTSLDGCDATLAQRIMSLAPAPNTIQMIISDPEIITRAVHSKYARQRIREDFNLHVKKDAAFWLRKTFPKMQAGDIRNTVLQIDSLESLRKDPFRFSIMGALPFQAAKKIAKLEGLEKLSMTEISAAVMDVLAQSEGRTSGNLFSGDTVGNTFCDADSLRMNVKELLGAELSDRIINTAIVNLVESDAVTCAKGRYVYRKATSDAEYGIVDEVKRINAAEVDLIDPLQLKYDIYGIENELHMRLAPEQRAAVKTAMMNSMTLLIGGPGVGKTTIEKVILQVYRKHHPTDGVLLIAPTGKAARRMSESTGENASTGHHALNVPAGSEVIQSDVVFDAGLIMIDEASMLDSQLFWALLKATRTGTRVVVVGDTNQLPSIGAGNVLYELIVSGEIAVARLETVYRQKAGSTIAVNCARIKSGNTSLEYADGVFELHLATTQADAVAELKKAYQAELDAGLSVDDICVLTPYRRTTPTGTNQLNATLQNMVNSSNVSIKYGEKTFRLGDKIICNENSPQTDVSNGDVGRITDIHAKNFQVDFGDGRNIEYRKSDLKNFDLAYAITIHRSQGSEYKTVIVVVSDEHRQMLKRNLVYTACSRAKSKVILIGSSSALEASITTEDVTRRRSRLSALLRTER